MTSRNHQLSIHPSTLFFESELFKRVQMAGLFADSKTFADATPKLTYSEIIHLYELEKDGLDREELMTFVQTHFTLPNHVEITAEHQHSCINHHIDALWQTLTKPADCHSNGSLLSLNKPYVVPGGRFREIYYWDSYFTALGLVISDKIELAMNMLDNFVNLQTRFGCIPNGNRSYYLSRSQPPILGLLVELLIAHVSDKKAFLLKYLKPIEQEYMFWMKGAESLCEERNEIKRVVRMPDGSVLNRYWDDEAGARPESYREDMALLHVAKPADESMFFRNIRAACESGWDFSSRWLGDDNSLASIRTTRIIPIDLNCLLFKQENLIAEYYEAVGDTQMSQRYVGYAQKRKNAINQYMWSAAHQIFVDYDLDSTDCSVNSCESTLRKLSLAGVLPLFVGLANREQGKHVATILEEKFMQAGGLVTTLDETGQQWDSPNGWAPLHWFAIEGLRHYQHEQLANVISERWLQTVTTFFEQSGKLMEKYDVCHQQRAATGGEYQVQEGFGWTNGVYQALRNKSGV